MKHTLLLYLLLLTTHIISAQPPYGGTIFHESDIITPSDPSAIVSTTYTGQGIVTMYDRRIPEWVAVNAYLFDVVWDDGLTSRAQINSEFGSVENARIEAEKYGFLIGQLPNILRKDVHEIWVHKGVKPFGGGNNSVLIHTGQTVNYENSGILEETLVHEAAHTSLDAAHQSSNGWLQAQIDDGEFISTYARDNPIREDIAESFLPWLAVRYRQNKMSVTNFNTMSQTIPNRLLYFDSLNFNLYPFEQTLSVNHFKSQNITIHHDPLLDNIQIDGIDNLSKNDIRIYNILGQNITYKTYFENNEIDVSQIPTGYYILKIGTINNKIYIK